MADQDVKVTLKGKDELSPALKSATKSTQELIKELEKALRLTESQSKLLQIRAKDSNREYLDLLNTIKANRIASNQHLAVINQQTAATKAGTTSTKQQAAANNASIASLKQTTAATNATTAASRAATAATNATTASIRATTAATRAAMAATRANNAANNASTGSLSSYTRGLSQVASRLIGISARYGAVAAAAETARRSFISFGETEQKLLLLQNRTKATSEAIKETGRAMQKTSLDTATNFDITLSATDRLRTGLKVTSAEAEKMVSRVNVVAAGAGISADRLAKVATAYMRNLGIPAEQLNEVLEMLVANQRDHNVILDESVEKSSQLGETWGSMGYKGIPGLATMNAMLSEAQGLTDDTNESMQLVISTMKLFSSEEMGAALGRTARGWKEELEGVKKAGGDVAAHVMGKFRQLTVQEKQVLLDKADISQKRLLNKLDEDNNGIISKRIELQQQHAQGNRAFTEGERVVTGAAASVERLTIAYEGLKTELGALMDQLGTTSALENAAKNLEAIGKWLMFIRGEGKMPSILPDMTPPELINRPSAVPSAPSESMPPVAPLMFRGGGGGEGGGWDDSGFTGSGGGNPLWSNLRGRSDVDIEDRRGDVGTRGTSRGTTRHYPLGHPASALGGLTGQGREESERKYGSSTDAKYLTAAYAPGGGGYGEGGRGAGGGGGFSPAGPGAYGGGTSYGGQTPVKGDGNQNTSDTPETPTETPEAKAAREPAPGAEGPSLPPGAAPGAAPAEGPAAGGTATGDYQGARVNQDVLKTRLQQANTEWMKDPKNQQKIFRTLQAEGGVKNIGANLEQMSNYAASRGKTLQQVVEARGKNQFYGPLRRFHGDPGSGPMMAHEREAYNSKWTPEKQKAWDKASKDVFSGGSNRINYATDQGTVGDPNYNPAKMTKYGGNMFGVQPGTERWVGSQRGKPQVSGPVTATATPAATPPANANEPEPIYDAQGNVTGWKGAAPKNVAAKPPETTAPAVPGSGDVTEAQQGKTRDLPIHPQLKTAMEVAAEKSGVKIRVTSGGQTSSRDPRKKDQPHGWTGSLRHNEGKAADVDIIDPKTGKVLALNDPRRLKFMEEAAAAGAGGTGAGYMTDKSKVHVGITGAGGEIGKGLGAYAGTREERAAVARGLARMKSPTQVAEERKKQIAARKGKETPAAVVAATPAEEKKSRETAYEGGPLLRARGSPTKPKESVDTDDTEKDTSEAKPKEEKVSVKLKVNDNDVQFARSSMRRQADNEVREARWNSYSDTGSVA